MSIERNKFTVKQDADGSWSYQLHPLVGNTPPAKRGFKSAKLATESAKKAARKI